MYIQDTPKEIIIGHLRKLCSLGGIKPPTNGLFEEVWKAYNSVSSRQLGSKKDARTKFKRLTSDELEALRVHLPKYLKNHVAAAKTDYLPNFTTYLNQRRYEDEKMPYVDTQDEIDNWMR